MSAPFSSSAFTLSVWLFLDAMHLHGTDTYAQTRTAHSSPRAVFAHPIQALNAHFCSALAAYFAWCSTSVFLKLSM